MHLHVLYFGILKDVLRRDRDEIDIAGTVSVENLLSEIRKTGEAIRGAQSGRELPWDSIAVAVNQVYAQRNQMLRDGDEVALLPPVSGGYGGHA